MIAVKIVLGNQPEQALPPFKAALSDLFGLLVPILGMKNSEDVVDAYAPKTGNRQKGKRLNKKYRGSRLEEAVVGLMAVPENERPDSFSFTVLRQELDAFIELWLDTIIEQYDALYNNVYKSTRNNHNASW